MATPGSPSSAQDLAAAARPRPPQATGLCNAASRSLTVAPDCRFSRARNTLTTVKNRCRPGLYLRFPDWSMLAAPQRPTR